MKMLYTIVLISFLTTSSIAANLPSSFKEAVALADKQEKDRDRATRIYDAIDLNDYYEKKYIPLFQSCLPPSLNSTEHPDISSVSFVAAIGADGRVLRLYTDRETSIFACVRPTLQKDRFPRPPFAPYYMHMTMNFSK
jgi:hypothetical protein